MAKRTLKILGMEEISARERGKKATQDKIVMAARALFAEFGYEASTLRQIAKSAGLGLTTLFNHISDKRDLIYMIFDEDVLLAEERAQAAIRPWQTFTEKIMTFATFYFQMFSMEPVLSRILMSEILEHTPGANLERHLFLRGLVIQSFEKLALEAQATGELKAGLDAKALARSIQFAFTGTSRWWISEANPDWRSGLKYFHEIVTLLADGYNNNSRAEGADTDQKQTAICRNG